MTSVRNTFYSHTTIISWYRQVKIGSVKNLKKKLTQHPPPQAPPQGRKNDYDAGVMGRLCCGFVISSLVGMGKWDLIYLFLTTAFDQGAYRSDLPDFDIAALHCFLRTVSSVFAKVVRRSGVSSGGRSR